MRANIKYLGTATVLIEVGGIRLLTDPVLNTTRTSRYHAGFGMYYTRHQAHGSIELGSIDAVLLSHDEHGDNLDEEGRSFLPNAGLVLTTNAGKKRLEKTIPKLCGRVRGLRPFDHTVLRSRDGFEVRVTATPCRHGPPFSLPFVGHVIGFIIEWEGQKGPLYISGDTVYYRGIDEVRERFAVDTALLHVGRASFPLIGHVTLSSEEAVRVTRELDIQRVIPIHFEGWSHFREGRATTQAAFDAAGMGDRLSWLACGESTVI